MGSSKNISRLYRTFNQTKQKKNMKLFPIVALTLGIAAAFGIDEEMMMGGQSAAKKCNKECKKILNTMIAHHNKYQSVEDFDNCKNVKIERYPSEYQTQVVAGTKYIFKDFQVSSATRGCGSVGIAHFEGVQQSWVKSGRGKWNYFYAEPAQF